MRIHGTFPTPWGEYVHIGCACGATRCVPATARHVRCRRCGVQQGLARLVADRAARRCAPPPDDGETRMTATDRAELLDAVEHVEHCADDPAVPLGIPDPLLVALAALVVCAVRIWLQQQPTDATP